jgi:hypothetical protein
MTFTIGANAYLLEDLSRLELCKAYDVARSPLERSLVIQQFVALERRVSNEGPQEGEAERRTKSDWRP